MINKGGKTFLIYIISLVFWSACSHYFPEVTLVLTFIFWPAIFVLSAFLIGYKSYISIENIIIPGGFISIIVNDYLFRIFGGGIHDDAGRGWCELIFYLTLSTTTISFIFTSI